MPDTKQPSDGDALLDEALSETFPASDPIAVRGDDTPDRAAPAPSQTVAVIGISGRVGSRIADELLARGHRVTGIARDPKAVSPRDGLTMQRADATQAAELMSLLPGHDAVMLAVRYATTDGPSLIAALKAGSVKRLLVVGGAGSLDVAPGQRLLDTPTFPPAFLDEARAAAAFLDELRHEPRLDWTVLSPPAELAPGRRTGAFRLGGDALVVDQSGRSRVSMEDFAVAMVDELERPRHHRARFTVGY